MRSYIPSIYLIKGAERKLKEQEFAMKKESEKNGKNERRAQENETRTLVEPAPQKRV